MALSASLSAQSSRPFKSPAQKAAAQPGRGQSTSSQTPSATPTQPTPALAAASSQKIDPAIGSPANTPQTQNAANLPAASPKLPASPPRVSFQNGQLTVIAENSSLVDTLNAIRAATGIKIEGAGGGGDRIMAKIGPAPVRDVLLSLLEGSRYDFAILGAEADAQKIDRLVLSPRMASGSTPATPVPTQPAQDDAGNAQPPASDDDDNEGFAEPAKPMPGAPPAAPGASTTPGQVKTPEQLLEDLRKLEADRAQQQQQAQPAPPADPNVVRPPRPERPK
jgi:hypothetical protein